jgi:hypothetical protein
VCEHTHTKWGKKQREGKRKRDREKERERECQKPLPTSYTTQAELKMHLFACHLIVMHMCAIKYEGF